MTIGSLFSGIGGLELGLEWAGLGPVRWQVEIDEKCRNCLATHWPDAKRFDDVRTVGAAELEPVDLICGGFPCQDVSSAGKRVGLAGARSGLWFEFSRIVEAVRPRFVVVENVTSGAAKWVDVVRESLERIGYASLPVPLAAADVGAWHNRERIFIVADRDGEHPGRLSERAPAAVPRVGFNGSVASDVNGDVVRIEHRGGCGQNGEGSNESPEDVADFDDGKRWNTAERKSGRWTTNSPEIWSAEPDVARMVHGLPGRVDRERALGNSVVPQCAEVVGHIIQIFEGR